MATSTNTTISFPVLDTLRFVGAFAVVLTHVSFQTGQYGPSLRGTLVARGDVGVAIFFVLSGFLLSRPYFSKMAKRSNLPTAGFYLWKRVLRIMPVYLLTVIAVLSLIPESRGNFHPKWTQNLTMTVIYGSDSLPAGLTQMWSLATEAAFYLVLPALMLIVGRVACRNRWNPTVILFVLLALCLINLVWLATIDLSSHRTLWLPSFLTWFCAGMAAAVASVDHSRGESRGWTSFVAKLGAAPGSCYLTAFIFLLLASTPLAGPIAGDVPTIGEAVAKNLFYVAIGFFVILPGVFAQADARSSVLMSHPAARYLGRISYGIFSIHLLVLYFVFQMRGYEYFSGHFVEVLALTMAGAIAASAAIYRFVERPVNGLRRLFQPKTETAISPNANAIAN